MLPCRYNYLPINQSAKNNADKTLPTTLAMFYRLWILYLRALGASGGLVPVRHADLTCLALFHCTQITDVVLTWRAVDQRRLVSSLAERTCWKKHTWRLLNSLDLSYFHFGDSHTNNKPRLGISYGCGGIYMLYKWQPRETQWPLTPHSPVFKELFPLDGMKGIKGKLLFKNGGVGGRGPLGPNHARQQNTRC